MRNGREEARFRRIRAAYELLNAPTNEIVQWLNAPQPLTAPPDFATWWADHDVAQFTTRLRHFAHPRAGRLVFEFQQLTPVEWPDLKVVCQLSVPGDDSAARLAAWHEAM